MKKTAGNFLIVLARAAAVALFSLAVMLLWNLLLPGIFTLPKINYWQAAGLLILARILFGGRGGTGRDPGGRAGERGYDRYRNIFSDRWKNMTEEERSAFMNRHGREHGFRHHHEETGTGRQPKE